MRMFAFSRRTAKEMLRDPLTLVFGLGFPVVLLLLLTAISSNVPVSLFELEALVPGMCIFGLCFMTLFTATVIAKDRETAFLQRLYCTPMTSADFIIGYALPVLPISLCQSLVCFGVGIILGLPVRIGIVYSILTLLPVAVFFISLGLLFGSMLNVKQAGGICGALLTNLTAWLSGIWFDLDLVGESFRRIASLLPFYHAVELVQAAYMGELALVHLWWVLGWTILACLTSLGVFLRQMKK